MIDKRSRNGLLMLSGMNDCAWNDEGICSVMECGPRCTYTQVGIWICSAYMPFGLMRRPRLSPVKCRKHQRVYTCRGKRKCLDCGELIQEASNG